jgi:putative sigma-54 modulation protein
MIKKLEVAGQQTTITPQLQKYVMKKIGRLDKYVARHARESVHAEVKLKETGAKDKRQFKATIVMYLPHEVLEASEKTINMFAAIDIVEAKLRTQLKKYKEKHGDAKMHRRLFARVKRKNSLA